MKNSVLKKVIDILISGKNGLLREIVNVYVVDLFCFIYVDESDLVMSKEFWEEYLN